MSWALAESLGEHGYDVSVAGDAASAIRQPSPGSVDVVLLDLRLRDCDDLCVLTAMRRALPCTPIVLMMAFGTPQQLAAARRLGALAVVDKPFDLGAVAPLLEQVLAGRPG